MNTRSQIKKINLEKENKQNIINDLYTVEINFDEAINAWRANKKCIGNGHYKYICIQKTKSGNQCKRESLKFCDNCKMHQPQPFTTKKKKIEPTIWLSNVDLSHFTYTHSHIC